ncbi:hypothetical protein DFH09DRAFT_381449 [Mycena vulgaris]|nr:hypothetical protein DFH09DRAFT_381449 [Mycena vulgaris]
MCWPSLDVVATFHPHAPFHEAAQGRRLVHEAVVVARNCGRNDTKQKRSSTHSKQVPEGGAGRTSLFTDHEMATDTDIDEFINFALADTLFIFTISDLVDKHRMFLIQPREVFDADGRPSLERRNCSFDFLSNHIANRIAELAEAHVDKVQQQLVRAFNAPATRSAAGKLVECMLHRALIHKRMHVPTDLGGGQVAGVLELIGNAEGFVLETHTPTQHECRPLYLRPQSPNFAGVNAILVTKTALGLIQSSLAEWHSEVVETLLRILARLNTYKIAVDTLQVVYCLAGTDAGRVKSLVHETSEKLKMLQALSQRERVQQLGHLSQIAHKRLGALRVVGYTFDIQKGLVLAS